MGKACCEKTAAVGGKSAAAGAEERRKAKIILAKLVETDQPPLAMVAMAAIQTRRRSALARSPARRLFYRQTFRQNPPSWCETGSPQLDAAKHGH